MIDLSAARLQPFKHQVEDTEALVHHPFFFIASEMRTGKTKIVIDAAQILFHNNVIDKVLVVAPAPVRDVWFDPDFGELQKHLWNNTPAVVEEYHGRARSWMWHGKVEPYGYAPERRLQFIVTNYEFIRARTRLMKLMPFCTPRTLLVLDESSYVSNYKAQQTKACFELRKQCGRVVLLNGTPFDTPLNLFSQGNLLHPSILDCKFITHYKARYADMEVLRSSGGNAMKDSRGNPIMTVKNWKNLEDLQRRFAPYTVRRLQADCLDLPLKLDPIVLSVPLDDPTWAMYKQMNDDMVAWLSTDTASVASQIITKIMRLAQITSGFIGGIENADTEDTQDENEEIPDWLTELTNQNDPFNAQSGEVIGSSGTSDIRNRENATCTVKSISTEKLNTVLWLVGQQLEKDPNLKIVVWCRFKFEVERMLKAVQEKYPQMIVKAIMGGQKKDERLDALRLLHPDTAPAGPVFVGGTFGSGSFGLNFTASHTSVNCSYDYSLRKFLQSGDRVYGPGQTQPISYFDIAATGPKGQRTIDHIIIGARRNKHDLATLTTGAWVKLLTQK
jgi:hypothetical protein